MNLQDFRATLAGLRYVVVLLVLQAVHDQKVKRFGPGAGLSAEEIIAHSQKAAQAFADAINAQPRSSK